MSEAEIKQLAIKLLADVAEIKVGIAVLTERMQHPCIAHAAMIDKQGRYELALKIGSSVLVLFGTLIVGGVAYLLWGK